MSNYELPLTVFVSLQRGSEILGALNQQAAVRWSHQQASPGGPIPQNMAKTALVRQPYSVAVPSTE